MDARVQWAMAYMERNLHRRLTVGELARQVNLSYWHFVRLFQAECCASQAHHLRDLRIRHGRELVAQTFLSIKEIAARVGIDESHFLREFRRVYGCPPARYRSIVILQQLISDGQKYPQGTAQTANQ